MIGPDGGIYVAGVFTNGASIAGITRAPGSGAADCAVVRYTGSFSLGRNVWGEW